MKSTTRAVIVDDDEAVRLRLTDLLTRLGSFSIHEAVDGPAGLALVKAVQPDIILLDIMMPGIDGFEAVRRIRRRIEGRQLPIIALTATVRTEDRQAAAASGMDDFLTKPIRQSELRASLERWLGSPQ